MAKLAAQGGFRLPFSEKAGDLRESFRWRLGGGGAAGVPLVGSPFDVHSRHRLAGRCCRASSVGRKGRMFSEEEESVKDDVDEDDEFEELERDELSCFRGLVLDISYRPVNVVCWRRAICLEFMEKADVLEYYDQTVSSPRGSFYIPAVLRVPHLLQVVKRRRVKYNLSRKSIFHRDSYTCQYCCSRENLTVDHVMPISKGGEWKWENLSQRVFQPLELKSKEISIISTLLLRSHKRQAQEFQQDQVTACAKCNSRKGQKTLEKANMKLLKVPKAPKDYDILAIPLTAAALKTLKSRKGVPEEWLQYLSQAAP